ncbi:pentatricopeptide repeat-containing protein 2, mitochondrial-like [Anopheles ziemanni]|uniref:pentatricopeptide repeat-containing protein 2, mitochondrial-like n=1 Tax=Anopheles coustani TaxID=139045 RepID=UPI00265A919A|nr:pentatricopeptide repeat-containing protein 2, mitochondrial-like [Anopheles coustani]XP_058168165.1 pentatricopeptide repeat-containing protein 2, mitochondrial-like [Anopheles ziemanni]
MFRKSIQPIIAFTKAFPTGSTTTYRNLYAPAALGIDGYAAYRDKTRTQHLHNVDNFKRKMREFVSGSATNMIFTEDLKNIIHLIDNNPEDKQLLKDTVERYNQQGKELRFGNYVFGPVIMRACYHLQDADLALDLFKGAGTDGFFDQLSSYQILADLLYENGRYQKVRELYDSIKSRQIQGGRFPKHCITLTLAACYKENTPAAYQYAMDLWKELNSVGHVPMRKATSFAAALALNNGKPEIAMEILSTANKGNYVTIRQLKTLALCSLNRLDDVVPIFRTVLEVKGPFEKQQTFCREVIERVQEAVKKAKETNASAMVMDLERMIDYLQTNGQVVDQTMDSILCSVIESTAQRKDFNTNLAESYNTRGGRQQQRPFRPAKKFDQRRPGLSDMN